MDADLRDVQSHAVTERWHYSRGSHFFSDKKSRTFPGPPREIFQDPFRAHECLNIKKNPPLSSWPLSSIPFRLLKSRTLYLNPARGLVWRSHIRTETKVQLYRTYIIPVLLYECETWTVTRTLQKRLDAFDTWCLRKILRIPYTRHTTNEKVRSITRCLPVSDRVKSFRLRFFEGVWGSAVRKTHVGCRHSTWHAKDVFLALDGMTSSPTRL